MECDSELQLKYYPEFEEKILFWIREILVLFQEFSCLNFSQSVFSVSPHYVSQKLRVDLQQSKKFSSVAKASCRGTKLCFWASKELRGSKHL